MEVRLTGRAGRPGFRLRPPRLLAALLLGGAAAASLGQSAGYDFAFEKDLFKTRFEHEVLFREAVIHVAWGAEALCHSTTQIEPFVLLSVHSLRRKLSDRDMKLFREVTGMDEKWRVVWADESAPDELKLRDVVTAINGRPLPGGATRVQFSALFSGGSMFSSDDQGFWDVMHAARKEASEGKPFVLTLEGGRTMTVETQKGCSGSVTASAFDADPDVFARLGNQRVKLPANALIAARNRDEFRWLAAFGTYFHASQKAQQQVQLVEGSVATGFTVGKVLALAIPGAGMFLSAAEANAERKLIVDTVAGGADLFANEVVAALGGDPSAGYELSKRMVDNGLKVDVVLMDDRRRANAAEHARQIKAVQAAQAEAERLELQKEEEAARKAAAAPVPEQRR